MRRKIDYVNMTLKAGVLFVFKLLSVIVIAIQVPAGCTETNFKSITSNYISSTRIKNTSFALTSTETPSRFTVKKWQVGRVSRKQYEIVNMLWRKTKIFINPEITTPAENRFRKNSPTATVKPTYKNIKPLTLSASRSHYPSSTPSYIEFYYLDDNDDRIKRRDSLLSSLVSHKTPRKTARDKYLIKSPILSLHVNDRVNTLPPKISLANEKEIAEPSPQIRKQPEIQQKPSVYRFISNKFLLDIKPKLKARRHDDKKITSNKDIVTTEKYFDNETCPVTTEPEVFINSTTDKLAATHRVHITQAELTSIEHISNTSHIKFTTAYDKIKFFEMYDQYTAIPLNIIRDRAVSKSDFENNMVFDNEIDVNEKVKLEDVDHNIGHHDGTKIKYVKKHIEDNHKPSLNPNSDEPEKKIKFKTVTFNVNKTDTKKFGAVATAIKDRKDAFILKNISRIAMLSEYPFAAVYVYEPSQIHCDAAALSPHWLVAAGSCLSRFHRKDPLTEGRSAFVTYCGQKWWQPERVSYVKYSIVHPRFHPTDSTRRLLYNIGLIQVVGSMSSCFGWAPISLMSHNFEADSDGSMATAVGWGLDRYDVKYTSVDLPKVPLSAYDGIVYSKSCPGSKFFSKMKLYNDQSSALENNLYCLSLPTYTGEENDPVHGSLLLVGGKLIALYLQEERRIWGEQSAQYTGVWRVVPWVHEVAREPDELDGFAFDI